MISVSILKEAKDYVIIKMPKKLADNFGFKKHLTEGDVLRVAKEAAKFARKNSLPVLRSLRDLK